MYRCTPVKRRPFKRRQPKDKAACQAFRREVLLRAGGRCARCSAATELQAHHLVPRSRCVGKPWRHDPVRNGAALCFTCHDQVHHQAPPDRADWVRSEPRP